MKTKAFMMIALLCLSFGGWGAGAWAQTEVSSESALTTALSGTSPINITLTANIELSSRVEIPSGKTVTIDLNGHKLSRSLSANTNLGMVIRNYGNLTINDGSNNNSGSIEGGRSYNGAGILCESGSTLTVNGGTFTNNDVSRTESGNQGRGGAIFMNPNTTLTVTGGVFDNNSAYNGGAIYLDDGSIIGGTAASATISGAEFKNCWVTGDGGAIYNKGTLAINGITVTANRATGSGGGIYSTNSLSMQGKCVVTGNTVNDNANNLYLNSNYVITCTDAFTTDTSIGITLANYNRVFTAGYRDKNPSANANTYFTADESGTSWLLYLGEVQLDKEYTEVTTETELRNAIADNAHIKLKNNIDISDILEITGNITVTIDLGDHTLNRGATERSSQVIGVRAGSTLHLCNGTVAGGWGGGGGAMFNEGILDLTKILITANHADDRGSAISNNGTLTMADCTVQSNYLKYGEPDTEGDRGGAIYNYSGKTASLTNCTIHNNTSENYRGGGICNQGSMTLNNCTVTNNISEISAGGGIYNSGTLNISGGTISGNQTKKYNGGGICNYGTTTINDCAITSNYAMTGGGGIWSSGVLTIDGCSVTGNSSDNYGDGIYIKEATVSMQGKCVVTGNNDSNVYLYESSSVITCGAFTSGTSIGVGYSPYSRKFTSGYSANNGNADPSNFFTSDNGIFTIVEKEGEAIQGIPYIERDWVCDSQDGYTGGYVKATRKIYTDSYSIYSDTEDLYAGWYVLYGNQTFSSRPRCHGDVQFILADGCDAEFEDGIHIDNGRTLTIYTQDAGTGKLRATGGGGSANNGDAAIGGNNEVMGGSLVIHGGTITAKPSHNCAAGIGGGQSSRSGMQSVIIYDGNITAEGTSSGAGIGGGEYNTVETVTIYGGTVTAKGGADAAGIGSGETENCGTVTIYGGTVTANGGDNGAGIGGGICGDGGTVTIYGGIVYATGGEYAAGIGGGEGYEYVNYGNGGTVTIYGGTVEATGVRAIGAGWHGKSGGTTNLNGGTVTLKCTQTKDNDIEEAKFISGTGTLNITNYMKVIYDGSAVTSANRKSTCQSHPDDYSKTVIVTACDHSAATCNPNGAGGHTIGSCPNCLKNSSTSEAHTYGSDGNTCTKCGYKISNPKTVTIYMANSDGSAYDGGTTATTVESGSTYNLPECTSVPNKYVFAGWAVGTLSDGEAITKGDNETLSAAGTEITVSDNVSYKARYTRVYFSGGDGSESDPFLISDSEDWDELATAVAGGHTFSDLYLQMTNDISVTTMVGGYDKNPFRGTFDGNGHTLTFNYTGGTEERIAPFRRLIAATIKNLHVDGTIETAGRYAAGIGGYVRGSSKIVNCRSSVTIKSSYAGTEGKENAHHGGIIALVPDYQNAKPTIEGCVFDGKILTTGATASTGCGGLVGLMNKQKLTLTNCLYKPAALETGETAADCATLYTRDGGTITVTDCYYTEALGTAQGTLGYTVSSGTNDLTLDYGSATTSYEYDGIKVYSFDQGDETTATSLLYDDKLYSAEGKKVNFTAKNIEGNVALNVKANGTLLDDIGNDTYTLTMPNENVIVTADIIQTLALYDNPVGKKNSNIIARKRNAFTNVMLRGRTLYKDGSWNTLCLPFDVEDGDENDGVSFSGTPLEGATVMVLDVDGWYDASGTRHDTEEEGYHRTGFNGDDGTLYLYFQTVNKIYHGIPYIVKWTNVNSDITNPMFTSTIEDFAPGLDYSHDNKVFFVGTSDPKELQGGDKTILYLGADNKLYYPSKDMTINSFRAYFQLNGITAGEPKPGQQGIRAFSLHFGNDSEQTGIENVQCSMFNVQSNNAWHSLDGRKLSGKPTAKGIYIYNGVKRVIK